MQLVIESATPACSIALVDGDRIVDQRHELLGRGHAERLLPLVQEMLDGRRPSSILVGCGPGSFTGLRVGLAAAHGLAIGWAVPLAGFSTLSLIAASAAREGAAGDIAIALHGGHGQLFVQSYALDPLRPLDVLQSLVPDEAGGVITAHLVVGSGAEALVEARGSGEWRDIEPRAADLTLLPEALRNLPPRPIYGRAADAKPKQ